VDTRLKAGMTNEIAESRPHETPTVMAGLDPAIHFQSRAKPAPALARLRFSSLNATRASPASPIIANS